MENTNEVIMGRKLKDSVDNIFNIGFVIRIGFPKFMHATLFKWFGLDKDIDRFVERVQNLIDQKKVEIERDGEVSTRDVVSLMIQENLNNKELTKEEILSNAFIFFIAGKFSVDQKLIIDSKLFK